MYISEVETQGKAKVFHRYIGKINIKVNWKFCDRVVCVSFGQKFLREGSVVVWKCAIFLKRSRLFRKQ